MSSLLYVSSMISFECVFLQMIYKMNKPRAYFCGVKIQDGGVVSIGGYDNSNVIRDVYLR